MIKRLLMVAYHFPPLHGSSGIQRTLKFSQYLDEHGWRPVVLTAHPRAYPKLGADQLADIPPRLVVRRAFALDAGKQLALRGRYPRLLALPDRWAGWWLGAVPAGLALVRQLRPQVIWSTYPIATAQVIALTLHKLTGTPWVADLRDPIKADGGGSAMLRALHRWIERQTLRHCARLVCTTPGTVEMYRRRYPAIPAARFVLIPNGYDEENFARAGAAPRRVRGAGAPFTLVHSGIIYPAERDPTELFAALGGLHRQGRLAGRLRIVLRACVHEGLLGDMVARHGLQGIVELAPHIPYQQALAEMLSADGLLVLQGARCNQQVPAKLYEYLRAGRPILALTDPQGDTAATLRAAGVDTIAPLDRQDAVAAALERFIGMLEQGSAPLPERQAVQASSRRALTAQLARLLDEVVEEARQRRQAAKSSKAP